MISANGQETLVWRGGFRRWLAALGPTAMLATMSMGAGTIGSNIAAGATMGYQIAWLIVLAIAWKVVMLYLIGKTTCITQLSVLEQYAKYFHKSIAFVAGGLMLLTIYPVMAFTGAVLGHALVFLVPALSPFAAIVICFFVIGYVYVLRGGFKWISMLCAAFVAFMTLMFVVNAWIVGMDVDSLWQGLVVPSLPAGKDGTILFVGLLGSTISIVTILFAGYSVKNAGWTLKDIPVMTWDICVFSGVFFCVFSLGIFISGTALLGQPISEPVEVAAALEPVAGPLAKWVFALGYFTAVFTTVAAGCYLPRLHPKRFLQMETERRSAQGQQVQARLDRFAGEHPAGAPGFSPVPDDHADRVRQRAVHPQHPVRYSIQPHTGTAQGRHGANIGSAGRSRSW